MAELEVRIMRRNKRRIGGGHRKFLWIFGATSIVCALLYWEQPALLYVLSTLAVCVLMLVVAFSNLEAKDKEFSQGRDSQPAEKHNTGSGEMKLEKEAA
jgi:hypothetical protein